MISKALHGLKTLLSFSFINCNIRDKRDRLCLILGRALQKTENMLTCQHAYLEISHPFSQSHVLQCLDFRPKLPYQYVKALLSASGINESNCWEYILIGCMTGTDLITIQVGLKSYDMVNIRETTLKYLISFLVVFRSRSWERCYESLSPVRWGHVQKLYLCFHLISSFLAKCYLQ